MGNRNRDGGAEMKIPIPPGFRFCPTDEELVVHFLHRKDSLLPCHPDVIPDLDIYPHDPWDLNGKAMSEGNKWYFYSRRMQNRITRNGCWKPLGAEEPIFSGGSGRDSQTIGMKRIYVFYIGDEPTNWFMQEFRLSQDNGSTSKLSKKRHSNHSNKDHSKWVICRVYERDEHEDDVGDDENELSCLDEIFLSLDDLDDITQSYDHES